MKIAQTALTTIHRNFMILKKIRKNDYKLSKKEQTPLLGEDLIVLHVCDVISTFEF